jgi:DNA-binding response OmpR family regulator
MSDLRVLWVDDSKPCPEYDAVARTYDDALRMLRSFEYDVLYLDHDLGDERTGYDLLMQIIAEDRVPRSVICISWNPSGRRRIEAAVAEYRSAVRHSLEGFAP